MGLFQNTLPPKERLQHPFTWGDVIQTALELEFPKEEAEKQLDTLINWGRYAELISYNDDKALVYLETSPNLQK